MSIEPNRVKLYELHQEVKIKTFEQIVKEHYTDAFLESDWLRRDYEAIRFHNFTDKDKNNPSFMLPSVNSISDLFSDMSFENKQWYVYIGYLFHCTQPQDIKSIWALPSNKLVKAFEEQIGPRFGYYSGNGYDWKGLTSFTIVKLDDCSHIYANAGGIIKRCVARVIDCETVINKMLEENT